MAFQFPWTNLHELNLDWFLSKFMQFTNNYLETTATAESVPNGTPPSVTVTGGELDDDTDIVDPFTFNFKIPAGQQGEPGEQGIPGQDGFSPIATVTKTGTVATITITDAQGTTTATISDGEVTQEQLDTKAPIIIGSASGSIASFSDGVDNLPMSSIIAGITPVQSGSGDPTPNNIRPITGRTGMTISHSGADTSNPDTISISWQTEAGTVYGGKLTINTDGSCTVVVNKISQTITGNDLNLAQNIRPEGNLWRLTLGITIPTPVSTYADALCNSYKVLKSYGQVNNTDYSIAVNNYIGQMLLHNSNFTTRQEIIDGLNASPIQIVYEVATPQTYQLTQQQLFTTLNGVNNVWSDTGDSTVEYPADTKLYIEQLTQPAEDDMTANSTIANGKFFMIGNNLYRATTTIASGSQIIPGTNATALSLADALNLL